MALRRWGWVIVLLIISQAGCNALGQTATTPNPAASTQQSQATPGTESTPIPLATNATQPSPSMSGLVTLRVWLPAEFDPASATLAGDLLKARLDEFAAQNPGVRIEVRIKAVQGPGGLLESLVTASSAAPLALPDLVALPRPLLESAALKGLVYPYNTASLTLDGEDWYEYARQMGALQTTQFGLPFAGDALVLIYRPDVLAPPQDWLALLDGGHLLVFPAADPNAYVTLAFYLAQGGQLLDEQGRPALTEGALLNVLEYYQQAAAVNLMPFWLTQSQTDEQAWATFTAEQHPQLITWLSAYMAAQSAASANLALAPLPNSGGTSFTLATGWTWALASQDPLRRELSTRLAEFLVDGTFLAEWTQAAGYLPTRPEALAGWSNSTLRIVGGQIARSAQLIPPADVLANLGPVFEQATVSVLKAESAPTSAVQTALEKLSTP